MNRWLYTFATKHNPNDSQAFIKALFAERQDYGQRILVQRQALFDTWQSEFNADSAAKIIEDQNLEHLRDHLFSTVNLDENCLALDDPRECLTPCLLYTSPSPRDATLSRMPSSA